MHKHGGDVYTNKNVIDFSANINMLGTPDSVIQAVREAVKLSDRYPDTEYRQLRSAIAEYEGISPEHIICGNGAAEVIFSIVIALRPKNALLLAPSFYEYEQALKIFEECSITYETLPEEEGFELKESILDKITGNQDILFLCNPNNPTGKLINHNLLVKILDKCRQCNVLLVLDECFLNMVSGYNDYTLKNYVKHNENLFILRAFTKMYAMAGLRLGFGFCSNSNLLNKMKAVTQPWNISIPAQYAGVAALKDENVVKRFLEVLETEKDYLLNELKKLNIKLYGSSANYIFFRADAGLYDKCLKNGIMIRDCSNYNGLKEGYYRIAVKNHQDNKKLIEVLKCI